MDLPRHCACGDRFAVSHALWCKKKGFVSQNMMASRTFSHLYSAKSARMSRYSPTSYRLTIDCLQSAFSLTIRQFLYHPARLQTTLRPRFSRQAASPIASLGFACSSFAKKNKTARSLIDNDVFNLSSAVTSPQVRLDIRKFLVTRRNVILRCMCFASELNV